MGRTPVGEAQAGFAGGLNLTSDPALLGPDQCRQMENARLSAFGAAMKRLGTLYTSAPITTFHASNNSLGGIYWPSSQFVYVFCAATNATTMHAYRGARGANPVVWTDLGACPQWRPVIFTDGTSEALYIAGDDGQFVEKIVGTTITTLGGSTAKVAGLVVYNDRLWGWKGQTLYYSNLSSAVGSTGGDSLGDVAAGGGAIIIRTFGASSITGCFVVNGILEIHHEQGISTLTGWGQDDIAVQPQALNAVLGLGYNFAQDGTEPGDGGVVANVAGQGDVCYFITNLGAYASTGAVISPLGSPAKPDPLAALLQTRQIGANQVSVTFNRRYSEVWFHVRAGGGAAGVYVYNVVLAAWSGPFIGQYGGFFAPAYFTVLTSAGRPELWFIGYDHDLPGPPVVVGITDASNVDGFTDTPIYTDGASMNGTATASAGTAVVLTLQFHRMSAGNRVYAKSWRWMDLLATLTAGSAPPVVVCSTQSGANTQTLAQLASIEKPYFVSPGGWGPYLDVTITDAGTAGTSQYAVANVEGHLLGKR